MATRALIVSPTRFSPTIIENDDVFTGYSGQIQVSGRAGNRWHFVLSFTASGDELQHLEGLHAFMRSRRNRVEIPVSLTGYTRRGDGGGTPLLDGAHSAGATAIAVDGLPVSTTGVLKAGDWLQIGNELKRCATTVDSDGTGAATIEIWPELHQDYVNNEPIDYDTPSGVFLTMTETGFDYFDKGFANFILDVMEDVTA